MRRLTPNIQANDPDFANLSQQILSCCIRNTEIAQEESLARGIKSVLSKPILKSVVATKLKCLQESEQRHRSSLARSMKKDEIILAAEECRTVLVEMMEADEELRRNGGVVVQGEVVRDLLVQCQLAEAQLAEAVAATRSVDEQGQSSHFSVRLILIRRGGRSSATARESAIDHPGSSKTALRSDSSSDQFRPSRFFDRDCRRRVVLRYCGRARQRARDHHPRSILFIRTTIDPRILFPALAAHYPRLRLPVHRHQRR